MSTVTLAAAPVQHAQSAKTAESDPLLVCEDVVQEFRVRRGTFGHAVVSAVDHVSFEIARGETLAIVGETGSGKSALARSLIGAPSPKSGRMRIGGTDVSRFASLPRQQRGALVQMVYQDPLGALDPKWDVAGLIGEPLAVQGNLSAKDSRRRVAEIMERVGLSVSEFAARRPREISGGQAQRVAIARALVSSPELVICDEPVTALDVSVQAQIISLLAELKRELKLTYLLIAHDLSVVRVVTDRVATMYLGRFCEIGDAAEIFERPAHPYTAALLSAIPPLPGRKAAAPARIRLLGEPPSPTSPPSGCRFRTRCTYAQDICAKKTPELVPCGNNHSVACHFPLSGNFRASEAQPAGMH